MKLLITFIFLNIANVIIQTVKSLTTIKCGKVAASIVNAVAYGFYTIVLVYMVCDLSLWLKVIIVGLCNLVGVYIVKLLEEKSRRNKIWKIEISVPKDREDNLILDLRAFGKASFNFFNPDERHTTFNIYCENKEHTVFVHKLCDKYNAKYFITETKEF